MTEATPQDNGSGFVRKLLRTEVTPTGVIVQYWSNAHGGEDVEVLVPMISSDSDTQSFVTDKA